MEPDQDFAYLGASAESAGDVDGDGYDDVIVGAYSYSSGQSEEGRAFVYLGSVSGLSATPDWTAESNQAYSYFGTSVGTAGDVNGDAYGDVVVEAPGFHSEGRVFVFVGSADGLKSRPARFVGPDQAFANLGESVGTAGQVDADPADEVIAGAPLYDNGDLDEGVAYALGVATAPNRG